MAERKIAAGNIHVLTRRWLAALDEPQNERSLRIHLGLLRTLAKALEKRAENHGVKIDMTLLR